MRTSAFRIALLLAVNVVITVITAAVVGPSTSKLQEQFGLVGWAARAPFYMLPLILTPLTLWVRPRIWEGFLAGLVLAIPLALWAKATVCILPVQLTLPDLRIPAGCFAQLVRGSAFGFGSMTVFEYVEFIGCAVPFASVPEQSILSERPLGIRRAAG